MPFGTNYFILNRMNPKGVIPSLCSVTEAAEILGLPLSTAQRWARNGRLPIVGKLQGQTGSYVCDRDEVEAMKSAAH